MKLCYQITSEEVGLPKDVIHEKEFNSDGWNKNILNKYCQYVLDTGNTTSCKGAVSVKMTKLFGEQK